MKNDELDNIDKMIITMLQENARMSLKEIAQKVYLSSPAVSARIDTLVQNGYIEGFHARINPNKLGYHIKAFINRSVYRRITKVWQDKNTYCVFNLCGVQRTSDVIMEDKVWILQERLTICLTAW